MENNQTNIEKADELAGYLSQLGMIPTGKFAPYVGFLSSNPAALISVGVLIDKINNGTATRNDYIHALTSLGGVAVGVAGLAVKVGLLQKLNPYLFTIGLGLTALDYLASKDYDLIAIKNEFLNKIEDITNNQQNKYEAWENLSPEKKAEWINSGGTPLDYDPILDELQELSKELEEKIKSITDNINDWNNANDPSITEEETSSEEKYSIVDVRHPDNVQRAKDEYHAKEALDKFSKGEDISLAEVIQAVEKSPTIMNKLKEVLLEKGNDDVAGWITKDGKFKADTPSDIKERVFLETEERNAFSTQLGSTIGGSIGSVIIANNDYSNIEKIAISSSTTVIGQNVGEHLFWDKNNVNGSGAFDDIGADFKNTLQGAIVSFAVSSFFAKNDNLSDILGMDGTFVGNYVDYAVSYGITNSISNVINNNPSTTNFSFQTFGNIAGAYIGNYLGYKIANSWIDTKSEAMGASIGSVIGSTIGAASSAAISAWTSAQMGMQPVFNPIGCIKQK